MPRTAAQSSVSLGDWIESTGSSALWFVSKVVLNTNATFNWQTVPVKPLKIETENLSHALHSSCTWYAN